LAGEGGEDEMEGFVEEHGISSYELRVMSVNNKLDNIIQQLPPKSTSLGSK
jgi:hypothetical protein